MPGNARRGRPQGKCHRKQTARIASATRVRVKGCGKSAPRCRQRRRQGKPHREQDQIGTVGWFGQQGCFRLTVRVGCARRLATGVPDEWSSRPLFRRRRGQNPAYRPSGTFSPPFRAACGSRCRLAVARCRQIATFPPQGHHIDGPGFELRSMASAFCCVTTLGIVRMKTVC